MEWNSTAKSKFIDAVMSLLVCYKVIVNLGKTPQKDYASHNVSVNRIIKTVGEHL